MLLDEMLVDMGSTSIIKFQSAEVNSPSTAVFQTACPKNASLIMLAPLKYYYILKVFICQ
jgi:hypothetical protein